MSDELTEARILLAALERVELRNDGDRRFVESWRGYLNRTATAPRLGAGRWPTCELWPRVMGCVKSRTATCLPEGWTDRTEAAFVRLLAHKGSNEP